jgi:hypothetical protein
MRPVVRYRSQLLFRKAYKPQRAIRLDWKLKPTFVFRPTRRFGVKPELTLVP